MRKELLLKARYQIEFSDALFVMIFGRKPDYKRDRQFLTRYLSNGNVSKSREELLQAYLEKGISAEQLAAIFETGIAPTQSNFKEIPSAFVATLDRHCE